MKNARNQSKTLKLANKLAELNAVNRALAARIVSHAVDATSPTWADLGTAEYIQTQLLEILISLENARDESEIDTACRVLAAVR